MQKMCIFCNYLPSNKKINGRKQLIYLDYGYRNGIENASKNLHGEVES